MSKMDRKIERGHDRRWSPSAPSDDRGMGTVRHFLIRKKLLRVKEGELELRHHCAELQARFPKRLADLDRNQAGEILLPSLQPIAAPRKQPFALVKVQAPPVCKCPLRSSDRRLDVARGDFGHLKGEGARTPHAPESLFHGRSSKKPRPNRAEMWFAFHRHLYESNFVSSSTRARRAGAPPQ
jgi:hypothetical protein